MRFFFCLDVEWASVNLGVFLCTECASYHRNMRGNVSRVQHVALNRWTDDEVKQLEQGGNTKSKTGLEAHVPLFYNRPGPDSPSILKEQWIRAKYERQEFSAHPGSQSAYTSTLLEGFLWKKEKDDDRYSPQLFRLSELEDSLKYFPKEQNKPAKASIRLSDINAVFSAHKTPGNANTLQLTYLQPDGVTRHLYVYHDDPEEVVRWYLAIRSAKLNRLSVAYPGASKVQLASHLTQDFPMEGWLWKAGPKFTESARKRWFTLDNRKLMYHDFPLAAHPRGEIFLGPHSDGWSVRDGTDGGSGSNGARFPFTLETPAKTCVFYAATVKERDSWVVVIKAVLERPMTPQDSSCNFLLMASAVAMIPTKVSSETGLIWVALKRNPLAQESWDPGGSSKVKTYGILAAPYAQSMDEPLAASA
ncbi:unnamed protein product [Notodromas monacha]|uniref:Uncharacterized protein n=1 Tax=Notodromas monacha TaxID=399045 RepID=A0A7R9GEZ5_9CRUS|nr:unnamed protein product [Notodromas monacha]CAG0918591.1 unnamed protein product [Notodromas monacha]